MQKLIKSAPSTWLNLLECVFPQQVQKEMIAIAAYPVESNTSFIEMSSFY